MYLYKIMIGCTPPGRNTEQHDVCFCIAQELKDVVPQLKLFWPEAADTMHLDAIRKVQKVGAYAISIVPKNSEPSGLSHLKLFFINLGGYIPNQFDEFHHRMLLVAPDKAAAISLAKQSNFYKNTGFSGAPSHVDDKYGLDVDDIYEIDDILPQYLKQEYRIRIDETTSDVEDEMMLGYFTIKKIEAGIYKPS